MRRVRAPQSIVFALVSMVGLCIGFSFYAEGRTMGETVGLTWWGLRCGLFLSLFLPVVFALPAAVAAKIFWLNQKLWPLPKVFFAFTGALLIGSLASEAWILTDEARFAAEVSKTTKKVLYSRDRAWPNSGCSLVFVPGRGIHSTD